jgi:hypothetical protein
MWSPLCTVKPAHVVTSMYSQTCSCGHLYVQSNLLMWSPLCSQTCSCGHLYVVKPAHVVTSMYSQTCSGGHLYVQSNLLMWSSLCTVKPSHVVTSMYSQTCSCGHLYVQSNLLMWSPLLSAWVSDCCQFSNFSAVSWREQVNYQWNDDEVRFVLDQHAELDFDSY